MTTAARAALFASAIAFFLAPTANAETFVDLRPKWEKGESVHYVMTQHSDTSDASAPAGGAGNRQTKPSRSTAKPSSDNPLDAVPATSLLNTSMDQEIAFSLHVIDTNPETGSTVEMKYDRMKLHLKSGDMAVDFDSTKPNANDPIAAALGGIVGTTLTIKMDASGNISSVTGGGDTLGLSALLGGAAGGLPKDALGSITPASGNPDGKAKLGDSWTNADQLAGSLLGNVSMHTKHTVTSIRNGVALVAIHGDMEPGSQADAGGFQVKSATTEGQYDWNGGTGKLDRLTLSQAVVMQAPDLTGSSGKGSAMKSVSKTTIQRTDPAPPASARSPARNSRPAQ